MTNFQLLCVTSTNDPSTADGRMGLGRPGTAYTGQFYVDKLKTAGIISNKKFSTSFDSKSNVSKIDFGVEDATSKYPGASAAVINMIGTINPYWQHMMDGFYFGDFPDSRYTTEKLVAYIDSGTPTLAGPKANMDFIKKFLTRNMTDVTTDAKGNKFFSCSKFQAGLPSLFVRFGDYWFEILAKDYAVISAGDTCTLLLGESENNWTLGLPFLRGYYTTFDMDSDQVYFWPQADSTKKTPSYGPAGKDAKPSELKDPASTTITTEQLLLLVAVILLVIVIWYIAEENGGVFTTDDGYDYDYDTEFEDLLGIPKLLADFTADGMLAGLWDDAIETIAGAMLQ